MADWISDKLLTDTSDMNPSSIDPVSKKVHFRFYPSGTSFKSIDHFGQLLRHG